MTSAGQRPPITFTRGRHMFQIAAARAEEGGYVGYCDGRVIARGPDQIEVARTLIRPSAATCGP